MKEKFKSIGGVILILFFGAIVKVIIKDLFREGKMRDISSYQGKENSNDLLETLVNGMNKKMQLPMRIDEYTSLVRVYRVGDDVLTYEYEIDSDEINVIKMKPILYQRIKGNIGKIAKENNFVISYVYKSTNTGKIIAMIRFEPNEIYE